MAEYLVTAGTAEINFTPSTTVAEIMQNVRTILSTPKYSVPLNREFGTDSTMTDTPMPAVTKARLTAAYIAAVEKYEPRAKVLSISFAGNAETGKLIPTAKVQIGGTS